MHARHSEDKYATLLFGSHWPVTASCHGGGVGMQQVCWQQLDSRNRPGGSTTVKLASLALVAFMDVAGVVVLACSPTTVWLPGAVLTCNGGSTVFGSLAVKHRQQASSNSTFTSQLLAGDCGLAPIMICCGGFAKWAGSCSARQHSNRGTGGTRQDVTCRVSLRHPIELLQRSCFSGQTYAGNCCTMVNCHSVPAAGSPLLL